MPQTKSPESVREALDLHQQLPFWRRVVNRASGHYPARESRELLRKTELGPAGRILENAVHAIWTTQRLNRTPIAQFNGKWIVADITGESDHASVPATFEQGTDTAKAVERLFTHGERNSTASGVDGIGFFVSNYSKWERIKDVAASNDHIGLVAFRDYNAVDAMELSRDDISALDPSMQALLERLSADADSEAFTQYVNAKPDLTD